MTPTKYLVDIPIISIRKHLSKSEDFVRLGAGELPAIAAYNVALISTDKNVMNTENDTPLPFPNDHL